VKSAYRDEEAPLRERIEELGQEQEALRARARELREVEAREKEIAREILETQKRIDDLRGPAMDLERLRIASPCKASWDDMLGDERVRFCGQCQKNVYNLSGMRRDEATALVKERTGEICVRMYRREDGTVLTTDCPVGAKKKNVRRLVVLAAGGGALAMAGASLYSQTMGEADGRYLAGAIEAVPREPVQGTPEAPAIMGSTSVPFVEPPPRPVMGEPALGQVEAPRAPGAAPRVGSSNQGGVTPTKGATSPGSRGR
jgi:hypothetical protein